MPLYVADYLADTGHLSTAEHGAYLLLIMHYWQHEGLPNDDIKLARIARMTPDEWQSAKPSIEDFFDGAWKHHRIDVEIAMAKEKYEARAEAGRRGGMAKAKQKSSNATAELEHGQTSAVAELYQSQSPSPVRKKDAAAEAAHSEIAPRETDDARYYRRCTEVLGPNGRSLGAKLLKAKSGVVALASSALELASTKADAREYLGAIIRGREQDAGKMATYGSDWG